MKTKKDDKPKAGKAAKGIFSGVRQHNYAARLMDSLSWGRKLKRWRALEAVRTGLLALIIKDTEAHGNFEKWWGERMGTGTHLTASEVHTATRSIRNYMRLASCFLRNLEGMKAAEVADSPFLLTMEPFWCTVHSGADEVMEFVGGKDPNETRKSMLGTAVVKWVAERSLMEIYEKEGIRKAEAVGGQHNAQKLSKEELEQQRAKEMRTAYLQFLPTLREIGTLTMLPATDRWAFVDAAIPALAHIADSTADFTPAQRKLFRERLVGISNSLADQLAPKRIA